MLRYSPGAKFLNGERLLRQGRPGEAAKAFREALSDNPTDGHSFAMLALSLQSAKDSAGALDAAREAIRYLPDSPFAHYVMGMVLLYRQELDAAWSAGQEAVRLNPMASHHYYLLALIRMEQNKLDEALELVDRGLHVDPEDADCLNLRGQLLIRLRRKDEATETARHSLSTDPNNPLSHANAGWTELHNNHPKQALEHFREGLRLDPGNEWAKAGLAEALKAKNPIYRVLLGFLLWMMRLDPRVRMGVIVGGYVAYRVGHGIAKNSPQAAPWIWPLLIAYIVFAWMTWVGMPLFDSILRLSRYGRHALNNHQRRVSNALIGFVVLGLCLFAGFLFTGAEFFLLAAIDTALITLITVGVMQMKGRSRYKHLLGGCGVLGLLMLGSWLAGLLGRPEMFATLNQLFIFGFIGMMWFVALGGGGKQRLSLT